MSENVTSLRLDPERYETRARTQATMFRDAINSGTMLVKSVTTGETKTISLEPGVIKRNISLSGFEVRDARIQPKHSGR